MDAPRHAKNFGRYLTFKLVVGIVIGKFVTTAQAIAEILGVDLSKWNWVMSFTTLFPQIKFGYLRGGYGVFRDERFTTYRDEFKAKNVPFGVYWFVYVGSIYYSMDAQVEAFIKVLKEGGWKLPPVADFENTVLPPAQTTAWIQLFMEKLQRQMVGQRLGIYTSPGWWNKNVLRNTWAKLYFLWNAHWTTATTPILPFDWTFAELLAWQFSADGNGLGPKYGSVSGDVDMDLNRIMISQEAFNEMVGAPPIPPAPPANTFKVLIDGLTVRSGPETSYAYLGKRSLNELVTATDFEIWIKDARGWSAVRHLGQDYMEKIS